MPEYPVPFDHSVESLKIPPYSIHAEQSVLGGLLLDNQTWDDVADRVDEDDFYRKDHRLIFRAIKQLADRQSPFDVVTLAEQLEKFGWLEEAGGLAYLGVMARDTPTAANIRAYADIVREKSVLRQLIHSGTEISDSAFHPEGRDLVQLLEEAEQKVFNIADQRRKGGTGFTPIKQLLARTMERIDTLYNLDGHITGAATGFTDLDDKTSGLQRSDLIIVAGRPSMGKTTFAMNIAEHVAVSGQAPVAVFSMEMPGEQLAMRMMSSLGRIDQHRVRTGKLEDDEWPRMTSAVNILSETRLFIDDTGGLTPTEVRARCRRLAREHGPLGLVVLDYLQLMKCPGSENRVNEISEISRSLKALAREMSVPVIALSQLNRSLENRPNKRPVMSDLRECVTGDTLVWLADGRSVPIAELVDTCPEVVALDEASGQMVNAHCEKIWMTGVRPIIAVELASGHTVSVTARHRLYTEQGWMQAGLLETGMKLARMAAGPAVEPGSRHWVWEPITALTPQGATRVYDLTVPGYASWVANGVISHNSGALEQDADVIMFIYRDEVYNPESQDKGIAEIIIAKQRNGPIGTVRLTFLGQYTRFENFISDPYADEEY